MLAIRSDLVDAIVAHARRDFPQESCGQLVGPEAGSVPERYVPMTNTDAVESDFAFSPIEDIRLERELDANGERRMLVVHSHTRAPRRPLTDTGLPEAYPSVKDIAQMEWTPDQHWLIVGLPTADAEPEVRSYHLAGGEVVEDELAVVESYMFAHTGSDDVPDRD
ncbi:M67 family metallopeptidase [Pseudonocardia phyllosphaerae]|uniref:Mov34/MPN/PAD-1 family protein n=1 Tax=Pseudonocardia phyllosphaerae TaxID=3390502 RepID=UPI00397849D1